MPRHILAPALALGLLVGATAASAVVSAPAGYIYSTQLFSNLTQSCVAAGPGGTFVGIGPSFSANAQAVVLAKPSGDLRLVAFGFTAIGDCAYDRATDTLYITDNADAGDYPGAISGDTVFAVPSASSAAGLSSADIELLPANSIPFASSVAVTAGGNLLITDATGAGVGSVVQVAPGPVTTTFASPFDYTAGVAVNPVGGNVFIAETTAGFASQIKQYTGAGVAVPPSPFAGPDFGFGSYDLAFNADGRLLVTGAFGGDVLSFNVADGSSTTFVSGLTFATSVTVDRFTHRVDMLSSTFTGVAEDKSVHQFTPIDRLVAGGSAAKSDCVHEFYGVELVGKAAECTDGAACDADGLVNDSCLFPIGFCINVADPALTECSTADSVTALTLAAKPASAALTNAVATLATGLPLSGSHCAFSDGYALPVKITPAGKKDGKASVKVQATTGDGRKDTDTLKLVCKAAP
ncbi:MAG: hypothetical protein ABI629_11295 [bacterium]